MVWRYEKLPVDDIFILKSMMIILFNTLHQLWLTINELNANSMNHTWLYINELYHWWFDNKDVKKSTKYVNIYTTTRQEDRYIDTAR